MARFPEGGQHQPGVVRGLAVASNYKARGVPGARYAAERIPLAAAAAAII